MKRIQEKPTNIEERQRTPNNVYKNPHKKRKAMQKDAIMKTIIRKNLSKIFKSLQL